jgi:hypothetical protein
MGGCSCYGSASQGQTFDLIADTGSVLRLDSGNIRALRLRAEAYYSLGDVSSLEAAVAHYRQGLHLDPEHKEMKAQFKMVGTPYVQDRLCIAISSSIEECVFLTTSSHWTIIYIYNVYREIDR